MELFGQTFDPMDIVVLLVVGGFAGWVAGQLTGNNFGLAGSVIVGIIGAIIGTFVFGLVGLGTPGLVWDIIAAIVGGVILVFVLSLLGSRR